MVLRTKLQIQFMKQLMKVIYYKSLPQPTEVVRKFWREFEQQMAGKP